MKQTNCGDLIYNEALLPVGSTTIKLINNSDYVRVVPLAIIPQMGDGSYDAASAKTVNVTLEARSTKVLPALVPAAIPVNPAGNVAPGQVISTFQKTLNSYKYAKYLEKGSRGADVKALQEYLKNYKDLYPEGLVTGTFGPATERAVGRFQEKYGLARKGQSGYGVVGPKTRAKLNEVQ
jgi:peptidoglycan hydrolase-like protein with peptidoglycan-binding domain